MYGDPFGSPWFLGVGFIVSTVIQIALFIFMVWATFSIVKSLRWIAESLEYMRYYSPSSTGPISPQNRPSSSEQKVQSEQQATINRIKTDTPT